MWGWGYYCYTCSKCKVTYYGETFRHFYTRTAEHIGMSNLRGKCFKNNKQSAISEHPVHSKLMRCFDSSNKVQQKFGSETANKSRWKKI